MKSRGQNWTSARCWEICLLSLFWLLGAGLAFALATIGQIRAYTQTLDISRQYTLPSSLNVAGAAIGVTAPGELDLFSTVTLAASNSVNVGVNKIGKLQILDQGVVNDADGVVAQLSCGFGCFSSAIVAGRGSEWNNSNDLTIGLNGSGALSIQAGGLVTDTNGFIAGNSGSVGSVTVTDSGSAWINKTSLTIGSAGSLTVEDGGTSGSGLPGTVGTLTINGNGTMTVDGPGASWTTTGAIVGGGPGGTASLEVADKANFKDSGSVLNVGSNSQGMLTITGAGQVSDTNATVGGMIVTASGKATVNGAGSQWMNSGALTIGAEGAGTLMVQGGASGSSSSLIIGGQVSTSSATLTGQGSSWTSGSVLVGGGLGTTSLTAEDGANLTDTGRLQVGGQSSNATLTISAGGEVSNTIGVVAGNNGRTGGSVTVEGAGSQWTNSGTLTIGGAGAGNLMIENGGVVNSAQSDVLGNGTVDVLGPGSQWNTTSLTVGDVGVANLVVAGQGSLNSTGGLSIGISGGNGTVGVVDYGSELNTSNVCVGCSGSGLLVMGGSAHGHVTGQLNLGELPDSSGMMAVGSAAFWYNAGPVAVGNIGTGSLNISGGGSMQDTDAYIAKMAGSTGAVTVSGPVSGVTTFWSNLGTLYVGYAGRGSLTIEGGANTNGSGVDDQAAYVGYLPGAVGNVLVSGPLAFWLNDTLDIGVSGAGTLTVDGGGLVAGNTITIGSQGFVNAKGGMLQGTVINHGTLDPLGVVTIKGDYMQGMDGTLILNVAGTGAGEFGQLDISGNATFDGTINLDFINGFAPSQGDSFDFINVGGSADFSGATFDINGLIPGFQYSSDFSNGQFVLTALNNGVSSGATPEPATLLLFGTALLGLAVYCRLRQGGRILSREGQKIVPAAAIHHAPEYRRGTCRGWKYTKPNLLSIRSRTIQFGPEARPR